MYLLSDFLKIQFLGIPSTTTLGTVMFSFPFPSLIYKLLNPLGPNTFPVFGHKANPDSSPLNILSGSSNMSAYLEDISGLRLITFFVLCLIRNSIFKRYFQNLLLSSIQC